MNQTKGRQERRRKPGKRTNEKTQWRKVSANLIHQIPINVSRQNFRLQDAVRCGPGGQGGRPVPSCVGLCPWSPGPSVNGDVSPAWGQLSFRRGDFPRSPSAVDHHEPRAFSSTVSVSQKSLSPCPVTSSSPATACQFSHVTARLPSHLCM